MYQIKGDDLMQLSYGESVERVKSILSGSKNIVALTGVGVVMECGAKNYLNNEVIYDVEDKYGRSPEEIMSSGYFNARIEKFFRYYKDEYLSDNCKPNETFEALKKLDDAGILSCCITTNTHGLEREVGIKNVIELYGTRMLNRCTGCGKRFPLKFINDAKGVPLCDECLKPIRPGIRLYGELIRNDLMTEAANACAEADALFVLGTNFFDSMVRFAISHYQGDKLVLITKHEHFRDKKADIVIHDEVKNVLPMIIDSINLSRPEPETDSDASLLSGSKADSDVLSAGLSGAEKEDTSV